MNVQTRALSKPHISKNAVFRVSNPSPITYIYMNLRLQLNSCMASVAQLVPTRGPCAAFFAVVPGQILKYIYIYSLGLLSLKT
jgi:hypothetical protein